MRGAFHQPFLDRPGALLRRRTTALVLVVAAHALLVLMLLRLAPPVSSSPPSGVTAIELIPEPVTRTEKAAKPKRETRRAEPQPAAPAPPPPEVLPPLDIIRLTPEEYAASDIAKLPSHRRTAPGAEAGETETADAEAARAPNGERLYNAEWYREPTQAELAYYLPGGRAPLGWAMIACQTVDDYRVDNCVEIGQSPAGSGLASAIRQAAWQFRVWPPRIGGRALVGAWVRIKIDFTELPAAGARSR